MKERIRRAAISVAVLALLGLGVVAATTAQAAAATPTAVSVSLQVNASPVPAGSPATVTVTVAAQDGSGGTPTGSVQVSVDGTAAGNPVALVNGSGVWQDSDLPVGAHQVTAAYGGDAAFAAGTADGQSLIVLPAGTSRYVPLTPARILDTRGSTQVGYSGGKPGPAATVPVRVTGVGGVPATGVSGVVLNVTATDSTAAGFVTAWPSQSPRPLASTLNLLGPGLTVANLSVTPVGPDGSVDLYTQGGADLVADVQGYFTSATSAADGRLVSLTPARILDTRGSTQVGYTGGEPGAGTTIPVQVTGEGGVPGSGVSAVAVNMTATDSTTGGFLTAWPAGKPRPLASNLNVNGTNQTKANAVWVPVGAGGVVDVYVSAGADVVMDVDGYFTDGTAADNATGLFVPTQPTRMLDTRPGTTQTGYQGGFPGAGATVPLQLSGHDPIGASGVAAVVGNTTVTDTAASGYVTVWPAGVARPLASNVNLTGQGDTEATLTTSPLGSGGSIDLFTQSGADLIFDVGGYFTADLTAAGPPTSHVSDQPAAGTTVFQASQVASITPGATSTTVVFDSGVTAPAVGSSIVVQAGGSSANGATGVISASTHNGDGTTTVTVTPTSLDSLYDSMSLGYDGPADLELVNNGQSSSTTGKPASGGGSGSGFNFANAFNCSSSGVAVAVASLTFENTSVNFELDLGLTSTPFARFTMSTEPVVEFSGKISGQVTCTLGSAFQNAFQLKWVFPAGGIPVTVTVKPTLTFAASAAGDFDVAEHFYRTIGFQTNPDLSLHLINNGGQHSTSVNIGAQLQASLAFGAAISVKVLDIAGVNVNVGPKFVATANTRNGQTCTTLTAEIDGSVNAQLNLLFKKLTSKSVNGVLGPWTLYTTCPVTVTTTSLPAADTGQPYDAVLTATGGTGPLTWSVAGGSLPSGLSLSGQGEISGTPTTAGDSSVTVQATDTLGVSGTADLTLHVNSTAQCVFGDTGVSSCDSTDPAAEVEFVSVGDTSACTFTSNIDWGDGSPVQVVDFAGAADGTLFPFDHTYTTPGTYTMNFDDVVDSGNCTFDSVSYRFTLDPSPTGSSARHSAAAKPHKAIPRTAKPGAKPGVTA